MASFKEPQFALPITLTATSAHLQVTYDDATTDDVTIPAGVYYLDDNGGADDLLEVLSTQCTSQADGTWVWSTPSTGLDRRVAVAKTGGVKTVSQIDFLRSELTRVDLGFSTTTGTGIVSLTGEDAEGQYQRRYVWLPRRPVAREQRFPRKAITSTHSDFDYSAVVDVDGEWFIWRIEMEHVVSPLVYQRNTDDSAFIAQLSGGLVGDPNVSLQRFWDDCSDLIDDGDPPTVRYAQDAETPSSYVTFEINEQSWLADLRGAAEVMLERPLTFLVTVEGLEV